MPKLVIIPRNCVKQTNDTTAGSGVLSDPPSDTKAGSRNEVERCAGGGVGGDVNLAMMWEP